MAIFWPENIQNITILLITPQFDPFGYKKQPLIHIQNEAWLNIPKIGYKTVGGIPVYDHPGGQIPLFWPKSTRKYCCFGNNSKIQTIKWCKAATLRHLQQSLLVFLQNKSSNNGEFLYENHRGSNGHILTQKHQKNISC